MAEHQKQKNKGFMKLLTPKALWILMGMAIVGLFVFALCLYGLRPYHEVKLENSQSPNIANGQYLARVAGCIACHSPVLENKAIDEKAMLAGGQVLSTKFGNFITPNISADKENGIGNWTVEDFIRAVKYGETPSGEHLFAALPYPYYRLMSDADLQDIYAGIMAFPPQNNPNQPHEISFPFDLRPLQGIWKFLFVKQEQGLEEIQKSPMAGENGNPSLNLEKWQRGRYLVEAVGHCSACHTPVNFLGGAKSDSHLQGGPDINGKKIPSLSTQSLLKKDWSEGDIVTALQTGIKVDGDVFGGAMTEVIENGAKYFTTEDASAIAHYLLNR